MFHSNGFTFGFTFYILLLNLIVLFTCRDFAQKLASALAHNPNSGLHTINLAGNPLEDRGTAGFSLSLMPEL